MTDTTETTKVVAAPRSWRGRLAAVGPGLVLAAGGVGAGDLTAALTGSQQFGMSLMWGSALGALLKFATTEALARLYMATGDTILKSVRQVGAWLSIAFLVFFILMGLLYAAALSSLAALSVHAMVPSLPVDGSAIVLAFVSFLIVIIGRYRVFESMMTFFVVVMFIGIVTTAALTLAHISDPGRFVATLTPGIPKGSTLNILALLGGVGGTFSIGNYGYWIRDKGWRDISWKPVMRLDAAVCYIVTFIFAFSLFVVGSHFLFEEGRTINGDEGLLALAGPLGSTLGPAITWFFLIGFFFVVFSSLVGGVNGLAYFLADSVRTLRNVPEDKADRYIAQNSKWFRGFVAYCTFPAMAVILLGEPVFLAVLYTAFGAVVLPLFAIVLLWHLNRRSKVGDQRNRIWSNVPLAAAFILFVVLAAQEFIGLV